MSRIRRVCLAASAVAALAFAIPTSASAISINSTSGDGTYDVAERLMFFNLKPNSSNAVYVSCSPRPDVTRPSYGWGIADGQASTPFRPPFDAHDPGTNGCKVSDSAYPYGETAVDVNVTGALILTLTELRPGQNPLSPNRTYDGRLSLHPYSRISFALRGYPGCTVTIAGPQSVELNRAEYYGRILVNHVKDEIELDLSGATFASTRSAACPSTVGNSVMFLQPGGGGWVFRGVTVTP